jgi:hypothetical protein
MPFEAKRDLFLWTVFGIYVLQLLGTIVAFIKKLPYEVGGVGDPDQVVHDFFLGSGTALSAPFIVLVILALLLWLSRRQDHWGTLALGATVILGGVMTIFAWLEPIVLRTLKDEPFGFLTLTVIIINWGFLVLILTLMVLCILEIVRRMKSA